MAFHHVLTINGHDWEIVYVIVMEGENDIGLGKRRPSESPLTHKYCGNYKILVCTKDIFLESSTIRSQSGNVLRG